MKNSLLIALIIVALISCKKKKTSIQDEPLPVATTVTHFPDTIKPLSYYPVYPGSYWQYFKNNSTMVTESTSATYVLKKYAVLYNELTYETTYDSSYVPLYQGMAIYGYQFLAYNGIYSQIPNTKTNFLTETPGPSAIVLKWDYCDRRRSVSPCNYEFITHISKTLNANGDSVLTATGSFRNTNNMAIPNMNPNRTTCRRYTKNVGLTFYCLVDTLLHDTIEKKQLVSYHIGAH